MTDSDDKLLRRYRVLSREEPPRALDDAILAASRRALAKPSWSRRWAAPVSIAAVLVLAFGVTLEMQREEPGVEYQEPARSAPVTVPAIPAASPVEAPQEEKKEELKQPMKQAPMESKIGAAPRPMKEPAPAAKVRETTSAARVEPPVPFAKQARPAPEAFAPSPQSAPAAASPAPMDAMRDANVAPASPPATARVRAMVAPRAKSEMSESAQAPARADSASGAPALASEPQRELERIAKLREDHRDEEADKALAQFQREYPDFRIPDAMLARVRPR